jgi:hypothetical protein
MSESSSLPDLANATQIPYAPPQEAPPVEKVASSIGGAPPPDIQAAARRLPPELQTQIAESQVGGIPSRLSAMEALLDPHKTQGAKLTLPGYEGSPFRGNAIPNIKEDDPNSKKPQIGYEPHVYILDLSKPDDLKDYEGVWTLVCQGFAVISCEEKVYDNDIKNWRIYLRWALTVSYMEKSR